MPLDSASIEMKTVDEAAREAEEANGAVGLFAGAGATKRYGVRTCGETVTICLVCFSVILNVILFGIVGWAVDRYRNDIDGDTQARKHNLALVQQYYGAMNRGRCAEPGCAEFDGFLSKDFKFYAPFGSYTRADFEVLLENYLKDYHRTTREIIPGKKTVVSHFTRFDADYSYAGVAVHHIGDDGKIIATWLYNQQQGATSMVDLAKKWELAVDKGDPELLDQVLAPDYEFRAGGMAIKADKFKPMVKHQAEYRDPKTTWTKEHLQHRNHVVTLYDVITANGEWNGAVVHTVEKSRIISSVASFTPPTTMMDAVKAFYKAVADGDTAAMDRLLAPNFSARGDVGVIDSVEAFKAQMGKYQERVKKTKHEYVERGPVVIALFEFEGTNGNETGASVYKFEAGRIVSAAFYSAEPPEQIMAVKQFYEGFDARNPNLATLPLAAGWTLHSDRGVRDEAWLTQHLPDFPPPTSADMMKSTRTLIEQGDTVVSHFAYNNNNGNGVTHGAAVHRLENAKIVETRMYSSEPEGMLASIKEFYAVADGKTGTSVSQLNNLCASDYKAWLNKGMKVDANAAGGEVDLAGFIEVAGKWAETPHDVNRTFVEQGDKIVSFYHEKDDLNERSGAAVHVFVRGKVAESYFYNAIES